VTATGVGAGTLAAQQTRLLPSGPGRALHSTTCLAPGTDWWFTGAEGRVGAFDTLLLANPGAVPSNLAVTAWATTGPLKPPGLASYTLPAGRSARLAVADYAPDAALVALHVHANSGRVAAQVFDRRVNGTAAGGSDWLAPTVPPATDVVVPGLPGGTGTRSLVLVNPGRTDATVHLRLSTADGNFIPAGHPNVVVQAQRTAAVDLTDSLAGESGAVLLHSDVPVTAAAQVKFNAEPRQLPDIAWVPAAARLGPTAVLPGNSPPFRDTLRLYLSAPRSAGRVRVTAGTESRTIAIPAGRTIKIDPGDEFGPEGLGPLLLTPLGDAPVYASRLLQANGDHGPLAAMGLPYSLPQPVRLPDARADLRAALP
jgi:hypothetical protein